MTEAFPLQWPSGKPRTRNPQSSRFGTLTFGRARDELLAELKRLDARHVVLSTNIPLRLDGLPYSNRTAPIDKGIAVYFGLNKRQMCFACDKWDRIEHNVQAITRTIEAIRGISRWGGGDMVEQAFSGFTALPSPTKPNRLWYDILNVTKDCPAAEVQTAYREMARAAHPDMGGTTEKMAIINQAYADFKRERGAA